MERREGGVTVEACEEVWKNAWGQLREGRLDVLEQVRPAFYLLVEREDGRLVTVRAERVTVVRK